MMTTDFAILIAFSNRASAQVLRLKLEIAGFSTVAVYDGAEAIRELESRQYDLIITDSRFSSVDGTDLCHHIRSVMCDDLPIILCSSKGTEADVSHAMIEYSINKVYFDPASPRTIVAGVRELLYRAPFQKAALTA